MGDRHCCGKPVDPDVPGEGQDLAVFCLRPHEGRRDVVGTPDHSDVQRGGIHSDDQGGAL